MSYDNLCKQVKVLEAKLQELVSSGVKAHPELLGEYDFVTDALLAEVSYLESELCEARNKGHKFTTVGPDDFSDIPYKECVNCGVSVISIHTSEKEAGHLRLVED